MRTPLLTSLLAMLLAAGTASGQTLSPPLAEYEERARSSFQITNPTLFPLTVVLQPRGFLVDEYGNLADTELDTARVKLKLSAMSFRLAPRQTYTVFYEAVTESAPAWFAVMAVFTGGRTQSGIAVRVELPHVVYLNQRGALARADVHLREFRYDTASAKVWLKLENSGRALGRAREIAITGPDGRSEQISSFPVFPGATRWVSIDWKHPVQPQRASVRFDGFRLEAEQPVVAGQP